MITLKTIQEHLREIDRARLIEEYHYRIRDRIAEEYLNVEHSELADLTLEDGKVGLLYLYDRITDALDYGTEPCCVFVRLDDVREHGADAQNYAYDLYAQLEIMGFLVSDDEYTQQNIYDLMVDVMFEASWFNKSGAFNAAYNRLDLN